MPKRITEAQKQAVLRMLAQGVDRETIAASVDITPGQVSAVAAHVRMGTYTLPAVENSREDTAEEKSQTKNLLHQMHKLSSTSSPPGRLVPILLGNDAETNEEVFWNPDPESGTPNPHVLVLGESGFGKTYTIACLLAELAQRRVLSVVLDYGQGFALDTLPPEFLKAANPVELFASWDGLDINSLQIFPSDLHGPVNVAQRVADTFARVYPRIGVLAIRDQCQRAEVPFFFKQWGGVRKKQTGRSLEGKTYDEFPSRVRSPIIETGKRFAAIAEISALYSSPQIERELDLFSLQ